MQVSSSKSLILTSEKIENHHMGDYRHIDMFSRTECHPKIDSARLEIGKSPFKCSNWGEKLPFCPWIEIMPPRPSLFQNLSARHFPNRVESICA